MKGEGWWYCEDCDVLFNEEDQGGNVDCCPMCMVGVRDADDDESDDYESPDWDEDEDDACEHRAYSYERPGIKYIGAVSIALVRVQPKRIRALRPVYRWATARDEAIFKGDYIE